jgi:signal peptidase I
MRLSYVLIILSIVLGVLGFGYVIATTGLLTTSYSTPSGSMIPTLQVGDMIFASSHYYRSHTPVPGDVVLFHRPWHGELTTFIKRVVAGPGDRVKMEEGRLVVNGVQAQRTALPPLATGDYVDLQHYRETLPNGRFYEILEKGDNEMLDQTPEVLLGAGQYFVMGDNRDNSNDSRVPDFGAIRIEWIDDRASIVWLSRDWHRIGMRLQPEP